MSDRFWNRKYLFLSSGLSASVNFVSSIIIVKFISFEAFGIWLTLKSIAQFSSILNLGISNSLLFVDIDKEIRLRNDIRSLSFIISLPYLLIVIPVFYIFFSNNDELLIPFLFFTLCLYLSNNSTLEARALKSGEIILYSNIVESIFGFSFIFLLYLETSLVFFICLQSARFFVKFLYQNYCLNKIKTFEFNFSISISEVSRIIKNSFSVHLRNWTQSLTQYGDKIILPFIFGYYINGTLGMGANLALPIIILISSTTLFLIPRVIESSDSVSLLVEFKNKIDDVLNFGIILSFLIPWSFFIFTEGDHLFIIFGFWLSVIVNLSQILSIWFLKKRGEYLSFIFLLALFLISYSVVFVCGNLFSNQFGLYISILLIGLLNFLVIRIFLGYFNFKILLSLLVLSTQFVFIYTSFFSILFISFLFTLFCFTVFYVFYQNKLYGYLLKVRKVYFK
jgi:hypothetical protein